MIFSSSKYFIEYMNQWKDIENKFEEVLYVEPILPLGIFKFNDIEPRFNGEYKIDKNECLAIDKESRIYSCHMYIHIDSFGESFDNPLYFCAPRMRYIGHIQELVKVLKDAEFTGIGTSRKSQHEVITDLINLY